MLSEQVDTVGGQNGLGVRKKRCVASTHPTRLLGECLCRQHPNSAFTRSFEFKRAILQSRTLTGRLALSSDEPKLRNIGSPFSTPFPFIHLGEPGACSRMNWNRRDGGQHTKITSRVNGCEFAWTKRVVERSLGQWMAKWISDATVRRGACLLVDL